MHKQPLIGIVLSIDGRPVDRRLTALLRALRDSGSLSAASRNARLSYRHAWGELRRANAALGAPLVELQRGRGTTLTRAGEELLALHDALDKSLAAEWPRMVKALQKTPGRAAPGTPRLRICASHDFALASLRDLAVAAGLDIDLRTMGSLDALQALAAGQCELAGFHVAIAPEAATGLGPLARPLRGRALRLIEFTTRRQGLILRRGKGLRIRTLSALADKRIRFINRQQGSGTRLLFDRLLAIEGIVPRDIRGYGEEEHTHAAVAAVVASGKADAAFGIEAAARAQGLDFMPLATERYYLAARNAALALAPVRKFLGLLGGDAFGRVIAGLPGYAAVTSHDPKSLGVAFTPGAFR